MQDLQHTSYRRRVSLTRFITLVIVLAMWEFAARYQMVDSSWSSFPSEIYSRISDWIVKGTLWKHVGTTLNELLWGFLLGSLLGILFALAAGRAKVLEKTISPFMLAIYSVPPVALAPLFILWFGLGITAKIVLIALIVFFLVYLNTVTGVKEVDEDLVDTMRIMGADGKTIFTQVIIPNAGLWILTALKQAIPKAITGTIAAEMIAAKAGMGYLILKSSSMLDIGGVFASLFVLLVVGLLLTGLIGWLEKYVLRWKTAAA